MAIYISMLRGINVSGQKKIRMGELKKVYESLGLKNIRTYIQSGNVVFESGSDASNVARGIEKKIKQSFGFDVVVIIRTKDELQKLVKHNPLSGKDIDRIHVTFLSNAPKDLPIEEINKAKGKSEEFFISGREIYLFCPNGYGKSKLSNNMLERKLKVSATTRNWKTVNKLQEISV